MFSILSLHEIVIKLGLAVVLAGLCGLERERKGRGAGFRTHVLVCLGATLATLVTEVFAVELQHAGPALAIDKGRAVQGVLTGVGFLGAGTILNVGFTRRGLTTAAMIWFAAALGLVIGAGEYTLAVIATLLALFTTIGLERIEHIVRFPEHSSLIICAAKRPQAINAIKKTISELHYKVRITEFDYDAPNDNLRLHLEITSWSGTDLESLIDTLRSRFPEIERIEYEH